MNFTAEVRKIGRRNFLKAAGGASTLAALGTTAPVSSWTTPSRRLVWVCASAITASAKTVTTKANSFRIDIEILSSFTESVIAAHLQRAETNGGSNAIETAHLLNVVRDDN